MCTRTVRYKDVKAELLCDPEVRQAYDALEPAYQIARERIRRGLTQAELASAAGTTQSSIARLESGKHAPSLSFLRRVAGPLGLRIDIRLVPRDS